MKEHILLILLSIGFHAGCSKQSNADDFLKLPNIKYKFSSYYNSVFCQDLLKNAQSDNSDIQIIQPLFETNDIHNTRLKPLTAWIFPFDGILRCQLGHTGQHRKNRVERTGSPKEQGQV